MEQIVLVGGHFQVLLELVDLHVELSLLLLLGEHFLLESGFALLELMEFLPQLLLVLATHLRQLVVEDLLAVLVLLLLG